MSLIETLTNIGVGFGISLFAQWLILPMLGVAIDFKQNLLFAGCMTAISIGRGFMMRRIFEALHIRRPLSPAMLAVAAERFRQIEAEGFTLDHDDFDHTNGELARAGAAYAEAAFKPNAPPPAAWPWDYLWWKQKGPRRDLVRAGALIVAEIERHDRRRRSANRNFPERLAPSLAHRKTPSEHAGSSE